MTDEPDTPAAAPQRELTGLGSPIREKADGMNQGMRVLSYLLSGVALYGLLGWLGDRYLGTQFLLPIGIVLGAGLAIYVIIRRFGTLDAAELARLSTLRRQPRRGRRVSAGSAPSSPWAPSLRGAEGEQ